MTPAGVLVVDKPRGVTSRKVTSTVGRIVRASKSGHAGTLDPLATGVLVVCLGRATLLSRFLAGGPKEYVVTAALGLETDTYDTDGNVVGGRDASGIGREEVEGILQDYVGNIQQLPPPYSAVKHKGKPMYHYARAGVTVEPRPRRVEIASVELISLEPDGELLRMTLKITCGPGTYVRSLIHDIGARTGTGACVAELRRVNSGTFSIDRAVDLELLATGEVDVSEAMMTMEEATGGWPTVMVDGETALAVRQGKPMRQGWMENVPDYGPENPIFRIMGVSGRLLALYGPPRPDDDQEILARAIRVIRPVTLETGEDEAA